MNEGKPGLRISSGSRAQTRRGYSPWHSWAGRNTHHTQGTAAVPACIRGVPQLTLSLLVSALPRGAQKPPQAAQSFPAPSPSQELALLLALSCEPGVESNPPLTHQALGAASFSFTTKRRSLLSLPQLPPPYPAVTSQTAQLPSQACLSKLWATSTLYGLSSVHIGQGPPQQSLTPSRDHRLPWFALTTTLSGHLCLNCFLVLCEGCGFLKAQTCPPLQLL